jgi:hypothetical protein
MADRNGSVASQMNPFAVDFGPSIDLAMPTVRQFSLHVGGSWGEFPLFQERLSRSGELFAGLQSLLSAGLTLSCGDRI